MVVTITEAMQAVRAFAEASAGFSGGLISFPVRVANSTYCAVLSILDLSTRTVINCGPWAY
jgi:hypothetical protein